MGFNAGAFAGALGTTAVNTYTKLNEDARQQQLAEQQKAQFEAWQQEQDHQKALSSIAADTIFNPATTRQQTVPGTVGQSALPNGQQGPTAQMQATPYSDGQKTSELLQRSVAAGVDPLKAMQISGAARTEKRSQSEDNWSDKYTKAMSLVDSDPVAAVKLIQPTYNNPIKGSGFDDGHTAEITPGLDNSHSVAQVNSKGKVISSTPITPETAREMITRAASNEYSMLPGKFKEGMELNFKGREVKVKEDTAPSDINKNNASAAMSMAGADYYKSNHGKESLSSKASDYAAALTGSGENDPKTGKPWEPAAALKAGYGALLKDPNAKDQGIKIDPNTGMITSGGVLYISNPAKAGDFIPATGLPNSKPNAVVAAFANAGPNGQSPSKQVIKPFETDYSDPAYNHWLDAARSGDTQGKAILAGWLNTGELNAKQKQQAAALLK